MIGIKTFLLRWVHSLSLILLVKSTTTTQKSALLCVGLMEPPMWRHVLRNGWQTFGESNQKWLFIFKQGFLAVFKWGHNAKLIIFSRGTWSGSKVAFWCLPREYNIKREMWRRELSRPAASGQAFWVFHCLGRDLKRLALQHQLGNKPRIELIIDFTGLLCSHVVYHWNPSATTSTTHNKIGTCPSQPELNGLFLPSYEFQLITC